MACKHCSKEMDEHSFLSCTCPKFSTDGIRIGYDYGKEYQEKDENRQSKGEEQ